MSGPKVLNFTLAAEKLLRRFPASYREQALQACGEGFAFCPACYSAGLSNCGSFDECGAWIDSSGMTADELDAKEKLMFEVKLGQLWYIGGCTGAVTALDADTFTISGTYRYSSLDGESEYADPWQHTYRRVDLPAEPVVWFARPDAATIYDGTDLPPCGGAG